MFPSQQNVENLEEIDNNAEVSDVIDLEENSDVIEELDSWESISE